MPKFRKKPVVIEAWPVNWLLSLVEKEWYSLPTAVRDAYEKGGWVFCFDHMMIPTLEGSMKADIDDMLIRGVEGEFYPCKPDIFEKTYEKVKV